MKKYIIKIYGIDGENMTKSYIPFETDDIGKFENDIVGSKDDWDYMLLINGDHVYFHKYKIYTLENWFEKESPNKIEFRKINK